MRCRCALLLTALGTAAFCPGSFAGFGKSGKIVVESMVVSSQTLHGLEEPKPPAPADAETEPSSSGGPVEYTIQPGDILDFQSFDDPSLSRQDIVVLHDGTTTFPLIEDINLRGKTRDEAKAVLVGAYKEVFRDPQFSLAVQVPSGQTFFVLGDVARPSEFPYKRETSVLEAVNVAGGLRVTARAGGEAFSPSQGTLTKAFIIRSKPSGRVVYEVDMRGLTNSGPHPSEMAVIPGDVVYVPEGVNLVYVLGEVQSPNVYQLTKDQTLLQLLSRAGGLRESFARARHIVLMRPIDEERTQVSVLDFRAIVKSGEDILMQPGDVVYVPRKRLVRVQEFVQRFAGSISPILDLYTNAYNAVYLDRRTKAFLDSTETDQNGLITSLQNLQSLGTIVQDFGNGIPSLPQVPAQLQPQPNPAP